MNVTPQRASAMATLRGPKVARAVYFLPPMTHLRFGPRLREAHPTIKEFLAP